eukprot:Blabericola_migrator_1__10017@NODE_554_length_7641_cov_83_757592_g417_i0_p2_GENE_NODE_554_length_7641_cov_83_757592_g417_i0NODE_554_length_7641_cov_83_757592_g417_i0_p2_ORF_typecomplete_len607_score76_07_NODE_554_length_7641_cov_83_757592_g417_i045126332
MGWWWLATAIPSVLSWAPPNPYLCDSAWPIVHHDSYSQGSTSMISLSIQDIATGSFDVDHLFDTAVSGTLSVYWGCGGDNSSVAWGSGIHAIFKVDTSTSPMKIIDAVLKPKHLVETDVFRGIYSVVSNENVFYSAIGNLILACTDSVTGNSYSQIKALGSFELDSRFFDIDEAIISLNILYTGEIAFLTNKGQVGVVERNLSKLLDLTVLAYKDVYLPDADRGDQFLHHISLKVSNSMTIDQYGGLYVVSSKLMHRLFYDSETHTLHSIMPRVPLRHTFVTVPANAPSAVRIVWATPYHTEPYPLPDRLSKEGSGTSPTLFLLDGELFVTVCDGLYQQNILVLSALRGEIVAAAPVNFGSYSNDESYTEQSILVHGAEMLVVQNALTEVGKRLNGVLDKWDPITTLEAGNAPLRLTNHASLAPVVLGDSSRGVQKFVLKKYDTGVTFTPQYFSNHFEVLPTDHYISTVSSGYVLESQFATLDFGCPNSIPTMSSSSGVMYCIGKGQGRRLPNPLKLAKRRAAMSPFALQYPDGFEGGWTISGVDWKNGTKLFDLRTGSDIRFNSLYAAVQIGPNGELIYGSLGGLIRARKAPPRTSIPPSMGLLF